MTVPGSFRQPSVGLLAVYSSSEEARAAADRIEALGVRPESIRIAEKADEIASLRAVMCEERADRLHLRRSSSRQDSQRAPRRPSAAWW